VVSMRAGAAAFAGAGVAGVVVGVAATVAADVRSQHLVATVVAVSTPVVAAFKQGSEADAIPETNVIRPTIAFLMDRLQNNFSVKAGIYQRGGQKSKVKNEIEKRQGHKGHERHKGQGQSKKRGLLCPCHFLLTSQDSNHMFAILATAGAADRIA
jgi:hypothetical protein